MNNKMTTNLQLSTTESKKATKTITTQTTRTGTESHGGISVERGKGGIRTKRNREEE